MAWRAMARQQPSEASVWRCFQAMDPSLVQVLTRLHVPESKNDLQSAECGWPDNENHRYVNVPHPPGTIVYDRSACQSPLEC